MSSPTTFLDYFILEAGEYIEELDGLLSRGGVSGPSPDADAMQRVARALRGTATMAKLAAFADLAGAIERVGRALQTTQLAWQPALSGALTAAVDDLRILLRSARTWSPTEEHRAAERIAELSRYAPAGQGGAQASAGTGRASATPFLATEAANIAAGLELLTTRPADATMARNVLGRVRALRGVAGVREIASLADALETTEEAARPLEMTGEALPPEVATLLHAAADLLRRIAATLHTGDDPNVSTPELDHFIEAQDRWAERDTKRDRIVPIAQLFYGDGGANVVESAEHPPTTMAERFRLELVSQGEHLRALVSMARSTPAASESSRTRRELRRALRSLQATAESFGESAISAAMTEYADLVERGDERSLATLDRIATALARPAGDAASLAGQLRAAEIEPAPQPEPVFAPKPASIFAPKPEPIIAPKPEPIIAPPTEPVSVPQSAPAVQPPLPPPAPLQQVPPMAPIAPSPAARVAARQTPDDLLAALDSSIAALHDLVQRPISQPVPTVEEKLVPIESLLYRGRAALDRAVEIRDQLRGGGPTSDPDALDELFDLLDLARAE
jgi:HPt (histidine-containing phosphotransfer) domain-containing protein